MRMAKKFNWNSVSGQSVRYEDEVKTCSHTMTQKIVSPRDPFLGNLWRPCLGKTRKQAHNEKGQLLIERGQGNRSVLVLERNWARGRQRGKNSRGLGRD